MRVLFASYDGIADGPGRSQTIPYLRGLADLGHAMAMFSYERADVLSDAARIDEVERELAGAPWARIPWRRSPGRDLAAGLVAVRRAAKAHRADLVHARGYVPAFLAARLGIPFLFDMRGFWPDERADGGLWSRASFGYRLWKRIERSLCRDARGIVVLTERAKEELRRLELAPPRVDVTVIPTCTDLARFRPVAEADRPPPARGAERRWLVLGSTGTWYLTEETFDLAAHALRRDPRAVLHVLTNDPTAPIADALARRRVPEARTLVRSVPPAQVPAFVSGAHAAIVLIRPTWSKGASCPTKLGELLACGVPVVANRGVGDMDRILGGERVGAAVEAFDEDAFERAAASIDALHAEGGLGARCRALAERTFALPIGVDRYRAAYEAASR